MKTEEFIVSNSIKHAPIYSGVFFLIKKGKINFIGGGKNVEAMISTRAKDSRRTFSHVYVIKTDIDNVRTLKKQYIEKYKPVFNFMSNPDFHNGKKSVLHKYLTKFKNCREVSVLTGFNEGLIGRVLFNRGNVPDLDRIMIEESILSKT